MTPTCAGASRRYRMTPSSASWPHRPDPRAPAADVDQDGAGKAELRDRLRRMAEAATAGPEREAEDAARERMPGDTQHPAAAQRKRRRKAATAKPDPGALLTDLQNARTAGEVLGAAARLCWAEAHDGAECPGHRIPAPADLADWVPMASPAVLAECAMLNAEAVTAPAGEVLSWPPAGDWPPALTDSLDSRQGARAAYALAAAWLFGSAEPGAAGVAWLLPRVHAAWLTIPAAVRTRHPAAPLVAGWQAAPVIVKADRRAHAILPATLRDLKRDPAVLPLGLDRTTPLGPVQDPEQGYLPGMEPAPSIVPPVPWLTLYDLTGVGPVQTRGRGAPLAQRLLVEVLTAVLLGDRDPEWSTAPPADAPRPVRLVLAPLLRRRRRPDARRLRPIEAPGGPATRPGRARQHAPGAAGGSGEARPPADPRRRPADPCNPAGHPHPVPRPTPTR